jgi:predicted nucleic acid-binding protein
MADVLVDSDVFIDHLRGTSELAYGDETIHYSVVTRCELFAGPAEEEDAVRTLLSGFREIGIDSALAEAAGRIRRAAGILTPDALIAATAIVHDLTLVSRNRRDYERVAGLRLAEPS